MRRAFTFLIVFGVTAGCAPDDDPSAQDVLDGAARESVRQEVSALTDSAFSAAASLEIEGFLRYLEDRPHADFGRIVSTGDIRSRYSQAYATLEDLSFDRTRTNIEVLSPDVAVVIAEGTAHPVPTEGPAPEDPVAVAWTFVWHRVEGDWRVIHYHQSAIQPPELPDP